MIEDSKMSTKSKKTTQFSELPILPVRDTVLFPNAILPLTVGRDTSLKLIAELKVAVLLMVAFDTATFLRISFFLLLISTWYIFGKEAEPLKVTELVQKSIREIPERIS